MFQITSDLHLDQFFTKFTATKSVPSYNEFCEVIRINNIIVPVKDSILLIAGDICSVVDYYPFIKLFLNYCSDNWKQVIWIAGNHEYYNNSNKHMNEVNYICSYLSNKFPNVEYLSNNTIIVDDCLIWGGTLWSYIPDSFVLDFPIYIEDTITRKMTSKDYNNCFNEAIQSMNAAKKLAISTDLKFIVLSHHAPMFFHMSDDWQKSDRKYLYATDLSSLFQYPLDSWICGHTHVNIDTQIIGRCRIISNSDPKKSDYNPSFVF